MLIFKPKNRPYSLRRNLRLLVLVCVLPATLVSAWLTFSTYELRREQLEQQIVLQSRTMLTELERELATVESGAKVLARAPELAQGDLKSFYLRASDALGTGMVYNYILTDTQGRQVLNTLRPWGATLPTSGTPAQLGRVFSERKTVLTDLFQAPVAQRSGIAMGVPVLRGDDVIYSLNVGIDPAKVQEVLMRQQLPTGWIMAIVDSSAHIVARSRDVARFMGQLVSPALAEAMSRREQGTLLSESKDGIPVFTAYTTSSTWKWRVAVGAPRSILLHDLVIQLGWVLGGSVLAYAAGLWLARTISVRLLESVEQLNAAAKALGQGEEVQLPTIQLTETEAVGAALQRAFLAMKQVTFYAQHDVLTGLPNRLLFDEVAERSLAFAERRGQTLAVIAIDLDGFKAVNDTQGHAMGDDVLKVVAQRIQKIIRASDIAARIGGDEFIVLLSDVDASAAMDTAHRIVDVLSQPYPRVLAPVSASVGVSMFPRHGKTTKALAHAADQALYRAKQTGKHRALLAE